MYEIFAGIISGVFVFQFFDIKTVFCLSGFFLLFFTAVFFFKKQLVFKLTIFLLFFIFSFFVSFLHRQIRVYETSLFSGFPVEEVRVINCKPNEFHKIKCSGKSKNGIVYFVSDKIFKRGGRVLVSEDPVIRRYYSCLPLKAETRKNANNNGFETRAFSENISLSGQNRRILRKTGLSHLSAVSGLHLGILAGGIFFILKILFRFLPFRFSLYFKTSNIFITTAIIWFYAGFTGFPISVVRASFMLTLYLYFRNFYGRGRLLHFYLFAVSCFLLRDPDIIYNPSFELSFGALGGIIIFLPFGKTSLEKFVFVTTGASAAVFPVILFNFGKAAPYSLLYNLIFVPVFSFFIIPVAIFGSALLGLIPQAGNFILGFNEVVFNLIMKILIFSVNFLPEYDVYRNTLIFFTVLIFILLIVSFEYFKNGKFLLFLTGIWFLFVFYALFSFRFAFSGQKSESLTVSFVADGERDTAIFRTSGSTVLIDAGADTTFKILKRMRIKVLDAVIISHNHFDHYAALYDLYDKISIKTIYYRGGKLPAIFRRFERSGTRVKIIPDNLVIDKMRFSVLWPPGEYRNYGGNWLSENNSSIVLLISVNKHKLVFTGDIEKNAENFMLKKLRNVCGRINLLKLAHHGHDNASGSGLLKCFLPETAVVEGFKLSERIKSLLKESGTRIVFTGYGNKSGVVNFSFK